MSFNKIGLGIGILVIFVLFAFAGWWVVQPSMKPLFGETVTQAARDEAQNNLMQWQVPFQLDPHTGFILLDKTRLTEVRARLAEIGIPSVERPGFELFSEAEYGMSDFTQKINYQRAIESEIAETIRGFADIKFARVHLTIPKETIFQDNKQLPKASVVVKPALNKQLSAEQIGGISQLVASSVANLLPEHVVVLDDNGNMISGDKDNANKPDTYTTSKIETEYAQRAKKLVEGIVQTDNIQVAVNAIFNYDRVKSIKEQVIAADDSTGGFLVKTKKQITSSPGVVSKAKSNDKSTSLIEEEYLFTKERSEIEYASGQIQNVSVGIVVVKDIPSDVIKNIEDVVASGLGLQKSRGDKITVIAVLPQPVAVTMPPDVHLNIASANEPKQIKPESSTANQIIKGIENLYLIFIFCLALAVLALALIFVSLKKRQPKNSALTQEERELLLKQAQDWIANEKMGNA